MEIFINFINFVIVQNSIIEIIDYKLELHD